MHKSELPLSGGGLMFVEELKKINLSETNAEQIIKDSKEEAKKIVEDGKTEAREILVRARGKADSVSKKYSAEGRAEADKQYEEYMQEIEASATRMLKKADANRQKAIDLIAERIVSNSVSR